MQSLHRLANHPLTMSLEVWSVHRWEMAGPSVGLTPLRRRWKKDPLAVIRKS
ncbi:hypothetical protein PGTUg99_005692 [Puccinia graminis f. sp. tritici]|nr:hypothetical protein PGTUg99_005692 [Puccinia graminis f. sp. tritici]